MGRKLPASLFAVWVLLKLTGRYVTGQHLGGQLRSDATFLADGSKAEASHWSRNPWWPLLAGWKRAGIRMVPLAVAWCVLFHRGGTVRASAVIAGLAAGCGLILAVQWWDEREHRRKVAQFAKAIAPPTGRLAIEARKAVHVPTDYLDREDAEVEVDVPHDFIARERDMEDITRAATVKLGLLNPKVTLALNSHRPRVILAKSQPPPLSVTFKDIREHILAADASQIILGLGVPREGLPNVISVNVDSETPHAAASMTTGDGKSMLAMNYGAQLAYRGALIIVLDYKWFSHMWLDGLPSVAYARTPEEIHEVLCWLGHDERDSDGNMLRESELTRRKRVALAAKRAGVKADLGPRILVIAEEQNSTVKVLKRYWRGIGGKGIPPSLDALEEVGTTGRQLLVNNFYIAQRLSAKASGPDGSADARENIGAIIMKDPTEATWKMLAGGHAQPPASGHKGRFQLILRKEVCEFQGALWTDEEARAFATSGLVAVPRHDMPLVTRPSLVPAGVRQLDAGATEAPDLGLVTTVSTALPVGGKVKLADMVTAGWFVTIGAARRASTRDRRFPDHSGGTKGRGYLYDVTGVYEYLKSSGRLADDRQ